MIIKITIERPIAHKFCGSKTASKNWIGVLSVNGGNV